MRILIVDDELQTRNGICNFLNIHLNGGHEICKAASGFEAIKLLDAGWYPDLLVTDVLMPEMDGIELAQSVHDKLAR